LWFNSMCSSGSVTTPHSKNRTILHRAVYKEYLCINERIADCLILIMLDTRQKHSIHMAQKRVRGKNVVNTTACTYKKFDEK